PRVEARQAAVAGEPAPHRLARARSGGRGSREGPPRLHEGGAGGQGARRAAPGLGRHVRDAREPAGSHGGPRRARRRHGRPRRLNLPTRFPSLLDFVRLPWFSLSEQGRLVMSDASVGPIADLHTHLALAYVRPMSVELRKLHPETQHYLPSCCAIDLDVYAN